ncbi:SDR family NAD(P)-dependent oxidoreductase [Lentilactobacillus kisonensis]|uniref:Oxidoreductase, short chain dehydrogenase/reductase family protein n=2 Tax=Lentilactobacillus kisonensis TaxID=481722 RepID=H1LDS0_9LACO|nr:SDR family NAD(P)-dependent oxidoreductase [Lentilactobacillus kisonensis]EHO53041.1 oxidoreductase, short chain dehydrogenase/reductase family protein [Lentilactobacillus kisonensis F0435]KRL22723.1 oxidoreductase, short chain dehydrogenase reductase family protein [Lentilactobacillus kisonensis DSM 19906 = JCM 15041]
MTIAIISGTTSGLGTDYVKAVQDECPDVNEIWMVARRQNRMEQIAQQYPDIKFNILALDLAKEASWNRLSAELAAKAPVIEAVISNAGVAVGGYVTDQNMSDIDTMVNLNVLGATAFIKNCIPYIKPGGFILSVSSVSSFIPNPNLDVYSATKAYLKDFGVVLRQELQKRKINVCTVFPGRMKTEMDKALHAGQNTTAFNIVPSLNVPKFAHKTIQAAKHGRATYTGMLVYKTLRVITNFIPQSIMVKFSQI